MTPSIFDRRTIVRAVAGASLALALSATAGRASAQAPSGAAPPAPVKIAVIVPLSAPWARQGKIMEIGARVAVEHVNRDGGIKSLGGAPLELLAEGLNSPRNTLRGFA